MVAMREFSYTLKGRNMELKILESIDNEKVYAMILKTHSVLQRHRKVGVSISGGSDSDILIDLCEMLKGETEIIYYFMDTGIEFDATVRHLYYLQEEYDVEIKNLPAIKKIPTCVKQYGQPWLSKWTSEMLRRAQQHNFKFEDEPFDVLMERYPDCKVMLQWWCNKNQENNDGKPSFFDIRRNKWLKEFLIKNHPEFMIDNACCKWAKKKTAMKCESDIGVDLVANGVRRNEGGIRTSNYKNCFSDNTDHKTKDYDEYRPLYYLSDNDKLYYKNFFGIVNSDCYEIYGMTRTGCAGCPYAKDFEKELEVMQTYEPKLYKAAIGLFNDSYEFTRRYYEFRKRKESGN